MAVLKLLSAKESSDRISNAEIATMIKDHAESMACDQDMMDTFMDRIEFDAYQMLSNVAAHHKVQTAHTLRVQPVRVLKFLCELIPALSAGKSGSQLR